MDSGSRERVGCSLRHCSNRWRSSNKSAGIAVCCWGMSQLTLHCIGESRIIAESSRFNTIKQAKVPRIATNSSTKIALFIAAACQVWGTPNKVTEQQWQLVQI